MSFREPWGTVQKNVPQPNAAAQYGALWLRRLSG